MDCLIYHNGTNITSSVVSYERSQTICSGVGKMTVAIKGSSTRTFTTWDTITLYEGGHKKGTYYVDTITRELPGYLINLGCQDASKRLEDFFVTDQYITNTSMEEVNPDIPVQQHIVDGLTTTRYWIEFFLNEAGVSYNFTTASQGEYLNNETTMGIDSVANLILPLLQQSGWYIYFNENNVCQIGSFSFNPDNYDMVIDDTDIISVNTSKTDKMLRNRVAVWGSGNYDLGTWVYADVSTITASNYDSNDKRAILISNSYIPDNGVANSMAYKALNEFTKINYEKEIVMAGPRDISIGDLISCDSKYYSGVGQATTVGSEMSSSGLRTKITLDQRCPRLFGYYGFDGYVYVGTAGNGIWRKPLEDLHVWEDYSSGLLNLNIKDLSINNGVMACVTTAGDLYTRLSSWASWVKFTPASLVDLETDTTFAGTAGVFTGVTVNKTTNEILAVVNVADPITEVDGFPIFSGDSKSWLLTMVNQYNYKLDQIILTSGVVTSGIYPENTNYRFYGYDVETDGKNNLVSGYGLGVTVSGADVNMRMGYSTAHSVFPSSNAIVPVLDDSASCVFDENATYSNRIITGGYFPTYALYGDYFFTNDDSTAVARRQNYRTGVSDEVDISETGYIDYLYPFIMPYNSSFLVIATNDINDGTYTRGVLLVDFDHNSYSTLYTWNGANLNDKKVVATAIKNGLAYIFVVLGATGAKGLGLYVVDIFTPGLTAYYTIVSQSDDIYRCNEAVFTKIDNYFILGYEGSSGGNYQHHFVIVDAYYDIPSFTVVSSSVFDSGTYEETGKVSYAVPDYTENKVYFSVYGQDSNGGGKIYEVSVIGGELVQKKFWGSDTDNQAKLLMYNKDHAYYIDGYRNIYRCIDDELMGYAGAEAENPYDFDNETSKNWSTIMDDQGRVYHYDYLNTKLVRYTPGGETEILIDDVGIFYSNDPNTNATLIGNKFLFSQSAGPQTLYYPTGSIGSFRIVRQLENKFESVSYPPYWERLDYSMGFITVAFGGNELSNSGQLYCGFPVGDNYTFIEIPDYENNSLFHQIEDARIFDVLTSEGINSFVGFTHRDLTELGYKVRAIDINNVYQGIFVGEGLYVSSDLAVSADYMDHFETSNFDEFPYMFISKAGVPPTFYQKDKRDTNDVETLFLDRTNNLPTTHAITCIRVDDRI